MYEAPKDNHKGEDRSPFHIHVMTGGRDPTRNVALHMEETVSCLLGDSLRMQGQQSPPRSSPSRSSFPFQTLYRGRWGTKGAVA